MTEQQQNFLETKIKASSPFSTPLAFPKVIKPSPLKSPSPFRLNLLPTSKTSIGGNKPDQESFN
jgi:hypothetical protein